MSERVCLKGSSCSSHHHVEQQPISIIENNIKPSSNSTIRIKLFKSIETHQRGVCWHYRKKGFCNLGDRCKYLHLRDGEARPNTRVVIQNDQHDSSLHIEENKNSLPKKKVENCESDDQNNSARNSTTTQCTQTMNTTNSASILDNSRCTIKLSYWISRAKELRYPSSVLRSSFEENGFSMIPNADEMGHYTSVFWGHTFPHTHDDWKLIIPSYTYFNHFPNSHQLSNKSLMALNFQLVDEQTSPHTIQFKSPYLPVTFYFPRQISLFLNFLKVSPEATNYRWIIKPIGSGEGRGIRIHANAQVLLSEEFPTIHPSEIAACSISEETLNSIKKKKIVVSQYIPNPLLLEGKKFDLRLYVLAIGGEPERVYLYRDGIVRLASEPYSNSENTLNNPFIHITNNTVNDKKNKVQHETIKKEFGFFCNLTLQELKEHFSKHDLDWNIFWSRLAALVKESIQLTIFDKNKQDEVYRACSHRCFEIFGFDVLIDENLNPYLLEVNSMPDLSGVSHSSHLTLSKDFTVKSKMLVSALNLVGLQISNTNADLGMDDEYSLFEEYDEQRYRDDFERIY
ncbi:hypothetical protein FDP41_012387 [Naegleria fowleri]|uniref:C3H1-type domain-containing protein n=1 Tax=Naegleria fowleri TaxID=5763 RepID=A0A6A5C7H7_NAEFO|nr:uncharacterized protein FDP41_012387 [Naegleria fowleri]KAF0981730.1 hypothetical protein FDP41_012387 [Naegleria fowleri]CAG4712099.1 unnamed protein product [Naegleria fowleri]